MITDRIRRNTLTAPGRSLRPISTAISVLALALALIVASPNALAAPKSKTSGNAPGNFRVTAKTACTVTVAWEPVSFGSTDFNYHLSGAYHVTPAVLPKTATSHTFTGLAPGNEYWFFIYAKDASGKTSAQSTVSTRTPSDTSPPSTAPSVSVTEAGSNYAALSWTPAQDDGCNLFYEVWVNGALSSQTGRGVTSIILRFLQPATTYSVTVRGYDYGQNRGPFSNPLAVTTLPANPNDHTPPTTPADVWAGSYGDGSTEFQLMWTQSTDDFDAQANIRYDVYVNGVLEEVRFGSSVINTIYGQWGDNLIEVYATDTAGNTSAPATTTIFF